MWSRSYARACRRPGPVPDCDTHQGGFPNLPAIIRKPGERRLLVLRLPVPTGIAAAELSISCPAHTGAAPGGFRGESQFALNPRCLFRTRFPGICRSRVMRRQQDHRSRRSMSRAGDTEPRAWRRSNRSGAGSTRRQRRCEIGVCPVHNPDIVRLFAQHAPGGSRLPERDVAPAAGFARPLHRAGRPAHGAGVRVKPVPRYCPYKAVPP